MSQAGSILPGGSGPVVDGLLSITGNNTSDTVFGDINDNIFLLGSGAILVTGVPGTNTLDITVAAASTTVTGVVQLATNAETIAGAVSTKAVTPTSLKAKLGTQSQYGVAVGATDSAAVQWTNAGTNGQVLIAGTGVNPAFATIESADNSVLITSPGANRLNLAVNGGMSVQPIIINTYDTPGTFSWTPNAATKYVSVFILGAGGGGGSGACGNSGAAGGGGGGTPGGAFQAFLPASYFSGAQTVVVGAGGTGGASVTSAIPANGNSGTIGQQSSVGNLSYGNLSTNQGGGGTTTGGGSAGASSQAIGSLYNLFFGSGANSPIVGALAGSLTGYPTTPSGGRFGASMALSGGGGGAGANSVTPYRGSSMQNTNVSLTYTSAIANGGIETGTIDGANGSGMVTSGGFIDWGVAGAGGGGQSTGTRGGNGGNGGGYGSGGGGGGGSLLNSPSGAGGNGAGGFVQIVEFF